MPVVPVVSDVKIKLRRGSTAEWASANPVLAEGEPGVDTDLGDQRIGNGVDVWADLPLVGGATAEGTYVDRPSSGIRGRFYWAADKRRMYRDDGSRWTAVDNVEGIFNVLDFGATPTVGTDSTAAFVAAIAAAAATTGQRSPLGGGLVFCPAGSYKISSGLVIPVGVGLIGTRSQSTAVVGHSQLVWYGDQDVDFITFLDIPETTQSPFAFIEKIHVRSRQGYTQGQRYGNAVVFEGRVDQFGRISDFQATGGRGHALAFMDGGLNVHLDNWRADAMGKHAIYWKSYNRNYLNLTRFTVTATTSDAYFGGLLFVEADPTEVDWQLHMTVNKAKIEVNQLMIPATGSRLDGLSETGHIHLKRHPGEGTPNVQTNLILDVSNYQYEKINTDTSPALFITPASNRAVIASIRASRFPIVGIPDLTKSRVNYRGHRDLTIATGTWPGQLSGDREYNSAFEVIGETNLIGKVMQHGADAPLTILLAPDDSYWATRLTRVEVGQRFRNLTTSITQEVTTAGMLGTLTGVTVTGGGAGVTNLNVYGADAERLAPGHVVSIAGVGTRTVRWVDDVAGRIAFTTTVTTPVTAAALTLVAPVLATVAPSFSGNGSPEGVVTAPVGSIYHRLNGVPGAVIYQKETGTSTTGWTVLGAQGPPGGLQAGDAVRSMWRSGAVMRPPGTTTTGAMANDSLRVVPIPVPYNGGADWTITDLALDVTVAGVGADPKWRFVVYGLSGSTAWHPGVLLFEDASTVITSTGVKVLSGLSIAVPDDIGMIFLGGVPQGCATTAPTIRVVSSTSLVLPSPDTDIASANIVVVGIAKEAATAGAAPTPFTAAAACAALSSGPRISFKAT